MNNVKVVLILSVIVSISAHSRCFMVEVDLPDGGKVSLNYSNKGVISTIEDDLVGSSLECMEIPDSAKVSSLTLSAGTSKKVYKLGKNDFTSASSAVFFEDTSSGKTMLTITGTKEGETSNIEMEYPPVN